MRLRVSAAALGDDDLQAFFRNISRVLFSREKKVE